MAELCSVIKSSQWETVRFGGPLTVESAVSTVASGEKATAGLSIPISSTFIFVASAIIDACPDELDVFTCCGISDADGGIGCIARDAGNVEIDCVLLERT